jgi:hypothetical protein
MQIKSMENTVTATLLTCIINSAVTQNTPSLNYLNTYQNVIKSSLELKKLKKKTNSDKKNLERLCSCIIQ